MKFPLYEVVVVSPDNLEQLTESVPLDELLDLCPMIAADYPEILNLGMGQQLPVGEVIIQRIDSRSLTQILQAAGLEHRKPANPNHGGRAVFRIGGDELLWSGSYSACMLWLREIGRYPCGA